jgi:sugar O-acyltransferase (sialic acid O-acetyltransferase NeuD family)
MKQDTVVVYGAGGHGKVIIDILRLGGFSVLAVVDDDPAKDGTELLGIPVSLPTHTLPALFERGVRNMVIAVGNNAIRASLAARLIDMGFSLCSAIHPSAVIDATVTIGPGTVVMAGVVINSEARIGSNAVLNTQCSVDHDCVIGDHTHISPGVNLGGNVTVGQSAHIGIGASVLPNLTIGKNAIIGGGAAVIRDIADHVTAVGVPAVEIRKSQ